MSEMVERVARAMCIADGRDPDADWRRDKSSGIMLDVIDDEPQSWRVYARRARAAIEAMREPTEAMVGAGGQSCADDRANPDEPSARACWDAMIDAALR